MEQTSGATISMMVIQASLDTTDSWGGSFKQWLIGHGHFKDIVRSTLIECERLHPADIHSKEAAEIKRTVLRHVKNKYGIAWWIPLVASIIWEIIEWWINNHKKITLLKPAPDWVPLVEEK